MSDNASGNATIIAFPRVNPRAQAAQPAQPETPSSSNPTPALVQLMEPTRAKALLDALGFSVAPMPSPRQPRAPEELYRDLCGVLDGLIAAYGAETTNQCLLAAARVRGLTLGETLGEKP